MNLNGDEKRIQQLFREMSRNDERRAPEFAEIIEAANSTMAGSQHGTRSLALVWMAAVVFIAMVIAVSVAVRHSKSQVAAGSGNQVAETQPSTESKPLDGLSRPLVDPPSSVADQTIPKRVRRRRHSDELASRMKALYSWQSPTASLMKAPGEEILKSLPRLGESLRSIKSYSPDQFN